MVRFPETKDEKFLLEIAKKSIQEANTFFSWIDWQKLSKELRFREKGTSNIVRILARTALVEKKDPWVRLTAVAMRHYGQLLCEKLQIGSSLSQDPSSFQQELPEKKEELGVLCKASKLHPIEIE